jgi:hypothetical protein
MKLFFPDSYWRADLISGSAFLYFHDEKFAFALPPSTTTFLSGANSQEFFRYVNDRKPRWNVSFIKFSQFSNKYHSTFKRTSETIEPLRKDGFKNIVLSYPRGDAAWESRQDLIASSELPFEEVATLIDPFSAADELYSHIFLEKFLEFYEADRSTEELVALGSAQALKENGPPFRSVDWTLLYEYCDSLFGLASLEEIFTTSYMFRIPILTGMPKVLLSNPNMVKFLASLPFETTTAVDPVDLDVVAWEIFRQLTSPRVDPINQQTVETIQRLTRRHSSEIDSLKRRCFTLAKELGAETDLEKLQQRIGQHIRGSVESEIQDLLVLNKATTKEFLDTVFSDQKTWVGIATFLYSLTQGGPLITAGAAIYSLSSVGSKVVKATAQRRKKLETSDYALIYRMST